MQSGDLAFNGLRLQYGFRSFPKPIKAADLASVRGRRGSGQPSTKTTGDYSPFGEKVNDDVCIMFRSLLVGPKRAIGGRSLFLIS